MTNVTIPLPDDLKELAEVRGRLAALERSATK